jgi:hypothetical protein
MPTELQKLLVAHALLMNQHGPDSDEAVSFHIEHSRHNPEFEALSDMAKRLKKAMALAVGAEALLPPLDVKCHHAGYPESFCAACDPAELLVHDFHYLWGTAKDGNYDKRLWTTLQAKLERLERVAVAAKALVATIEDGERATWTGGRSAWLNAKDKAEKRLREEVKT